MPCLSDCPDCNRNQFDCRCYKSASLKDKKSAFNITGALCDVLSLVQEKSALVFREIDPEIIKWWNTHTKNEEDKIKKQALAKLTPSERKVLGL